MYTTDQIYFTIPGVNTNIKPKVEASTKLGMHFLILVTTGNAPGTIKSYIDNNLEHTIQYTVKKDENNGCPKYLFEKITINGTQTEQNVNGRVILLEK